MKRSARKDRDFYRQQLQRPESPVDAQGRTIEQAVASEFAEQGPLLRDILDAKDRHTGVIDILSTSTPTPKTQRTPPTIEAVDYAISIPGQRVMLTPKTFETLPNSVLNNLPQKTLDELMDATRDNRSAAEKYRGKAPRQERVEPKPTARIHPRIKPAQNDPGGQWRK